MSLTLAQYLLGLASGSLVGFVLALVGGGGSILAVPLMVYVVGVHQAQLAIGTSACAVTMNAVASLAVHSRRGYVKWRCAGVFALAGAAGAFFGSTLGKALGGERLLVLFAGLMMVVAVLQMRRRAVATEAEPAFDAPLAGRLALTGGCTGMLSGFFGIGGGFLIVPALMRTTNMPILNAIGSSLVAVIAFGLVTALNYAAAGWVDWSLAGALVAGGLAGGVVGAGLARHLNGYKSALNTVFASLVFLVGVYMLLRSLNHAA